MGELGLQEHPARWDTRLKEGLTHLPHPPFSQEAASPKGTSGQLCLQLQGRTQTEQEGVTSAHSSWPLVKQAG